MRQVETGVTASKSLHIRNSNRIIFIFPYNLIMLLVSVQIRVLVSLKSKLNFWTGMITQKLN